MEVDLAPGLPGLQLVGLGDTSGREARERVRSALRNSGFRVPQTRVVVSLAPAIPAMIDKRANLLAELGFRQCCRLRAVRKQR